jgi:hypothetical protein
VICIAADGWSRKPFIIPELATVEAEGGLRGYSEDFCAMAPAEVQLDW